MVLKVLNNGGILGIIKRSGTPSVFRAGICSVVNQVLDDVNVTSRSSEVKASTLVIVSRV